MRGYNTTNGTFSFVVYQDIIKNGLYPNVTSRNIYLPNRDNCDMVFKFWGQNLLFTKILIIGKRGEKSK